MRKRTWALLFMVIALVIGYFILFYKTYDVRQVAASADCVISIDIKRVRNTVIWNNLSTPSQWKKISFSGSKKISWRDMFRLPDYLFIFHCKQQPVNAWYTVLAIKDDIDFKKVCQRFGFVENLRNQLPEYYSEELGIAMLRNGNEVLMHFGHLKDSTLLRSTGNELFIRRQYASREFLEVNTTAASHLALQFFPESLLEKETIVKANFNKQEIVVEALLKPKNHLALRDNSIFNYNSRAWLSAGFTHELMQVFDHLDPSIQQKISRAAGFKIDSVLLNNTHSSIEISGINQRTDSAVSYTYDDNFNPVEHVVENTTREPAFTWDIYGQGSASAYQYWLNNGFIEKTAHGNQFLPFPFSKSYCTLSPGTLTVSSAVHQAQTDNRINALLFLHIQVGDIPIQVLSLLPARGSYLENIESLHMQAYRDAEAITFKCSLLKKKNDLPIIKW